MRNNFGVDEIPLTYTKPSVIKETRAHFNSLLKRAANQGEDANSSVNIFTSMFFLLFWL